MQDLQVSKSSGSESNWPGLEEPPLIGGGIFEQVIWLSEPQFPSQDNGHSES